MNEQSTVPLAEGAVTGPAGTSARLDAVSASTVPSRAAEPTGYGSLWRGVPRELGFLLLTMPIAIVGLSVLASLFWTGLGTIVIYVGFFIVVATFYTARAFGIVELTRLDWAGRPAIPRPVWEPADQPRTFWRILFGPWANGHYWLYLLHGMIVNPIVSIVSWSITITWTATALGGLTAGSGSGSSRPGTATSSCPGWSWTPSSASTRPSTRWRATASCT